MVDFMMDLIVDLDGEILMICKLMVDLDGGKILDWTVDRMVDRMLDWTW